jgi:hypothetical protein
MWAHCTAPHHVLKYVEVVTNARSTNNSIKEWN